MIKIVFIIYVYIYIRLLNILFVHKIAIKNLKNKTKAINIGCLIMLILIMLNLPNTVILYFFSSIIILLRFFLLRIYYCFMDHNGSRTFILELKLNYFFGYFSFFRRRKRLILVSIIILFIFFTKLCIILCIIHRLLRTFYFDLKPVDNDYGVLYKVNNDSIILTSLGLKKSMEYKLNLFGFSHCCNTPFVFEQDYVFSDLDYHEFLKEER